MKTKYLITLYLVLPFLVEVYADYEQDVKRAAFPFMAFLYYPDESVVDGNGARFLRGAVLIQPDWLVTSAVGPSIITDGPHGFPTKTLLARAGAINIDTNFTLNEDEDEQEREVIRIVRPYNYSSTQWWHTDISLMKTLLPFNMTLAVSVTLLVNKLEYLEKTCLILVYAKKDGNITEDRSLMQLAVDLLPPSVTNCGPHFIGKTMTCAVDGEEGKSAVYDPNFCQGNSGGPLICEGDVIGIQTYIDNNCKQPHLYQLLSAWENFITCGTEEKCHEEQCNKICDVSNKDPLDNDLMDLAKSVTTNEKASEVITSYTTIETSSEEKIRTSTTTTTHEEEMISEQSTPELSTIEQATDQTTDEETTSSTSWPKQKYTDSRKSLDEGDTDDTSRKTEVEAQQQDIKEPQKKRSAAHTMILQKYIFFGYFILACLI